ncbi:MAG: hypothetical protein NT157_01205, partial [Candidatus Micrarchaeota archaeon]|nr:hypothetical protein [Candidatus Micrarchaeota archaeon]
ADIFTGDESVFYLSFHQDPSTTYPGTGFEKESTANTKNVVVMPGAGDEKYLKIFRESVGKYFEEFKPDLVAVSAGFDTYCEDAIVGSRIGIKKSETYGEIGGIIAGFGVRTFAVLEGGYYVPKLGENVFEFIKPFVR